MAFSILAKPGTKEGPCKKKCEHRDCAATRKVAETKCVLCHKEIGYDVAWSSYGDYDCHRLCLELAAEQGHLQDPSAYKKA